MSQFRELELLPRGRFCCWSRDRRQNQCRWTLHLGFRRGLSLIQSLDRRSRSSRRYRRRTCSWVQWSSCLWFGRGPWKRARTWVCWSFGTRDWGRPKWVNNISYEIEEIGILVSGLHVGSISHSIGVFLVVVNGLGLAHILILKMIT